MARDIVELGGSLGFLDEMYDQARSDPAATDVSWNELVAPMGAAQRNGHATDGTDASGVVSAEIDLPPHSPGSAARSGEAGAIDLPPHSPGSAARSGEAGAIDLPPHSPGSAARSGDAGAIAISRGTTRPMPNLARPGSVTMSPIAMAETPSVWPLVNAFRWVGHFAADLDPLGLLETAHVAELDPETWGFRDPNAMIEPTGVHGLPRARLGDLVSHLRRVYAGSVGLEYMHISSAVRRSWLSRHMETVQPISSDVRLRMLALLINAEQFERFCHTKYPGTKRFSLEGSESLIPLLDLMLSHGARLGAIEAVLGMSHRGRLTALESVLRRPGRELFGHFEDVEPEKALGGGDVKYHLGFSTDRIDAHGNAMHLSLTFNPSHLEAVDPVVCGRVRAKQVRHGDVEMRKVMGIIVHGDAAFAGQGLVPETLQLSSLPGYRTGGTVHIIVNNQVGFTASPAEQRSTPYCTDIAKMIECPIWHVNGEDLDAVARVTQLACEYRYEFSSDVVIDMYCYRKYGHNENDEPAFTQPIMYDRIKTKPSPVEVYAKRLIDERVLTADDVGAMTARRLTELQAEHAAAKATRARPSVTSMTAMWRGYRGGLLEAPEEIATGIDRQLLESIAHSITQVPADFTPHPKIIRLFEQRAEMGRGEKPLDWGMGELLTYGSLLHQGTNVRMTGQDCSRGTFSHRHAVITDVKNGREHLVLGSLHPDQGQVRIYDSPLSEAGVLGFEFGYSLDYPDALVIWEAQFGDFANGAQVVIDQFVTTSEDKWKRLSGIVLLLPHGYEGQGPEHSSARLERYLQNCAEQNIRIAQPTTPAQMFHLLRGQVLSTQRKPLVVFTPKSLLRLPAAVSTLDEFANGKFQRVIGDTSANPNNVTRALLCTGRVYYDLVEERAKRGAFDTAIIRVESLYPWWPELISAALAPYAGLRQVKWVQDEPLNMGAASYVAPRLSKLLPNLVTLDVVARPESASPATGSHNAHVIEQRKILSDAFGG